MEQRKKRSWFLRLLESGLERGLAGLDWVARRRGRTMTAAHLATGSSGEDAAFFELRRKGYTVVARRWSGGNLPGDMDLIAWAGDLLCFVEVKTRTARDLTPAESAVDGHKRRVLRRLAQAYVRQLPQAQMPEVRFDVMSVYCVPGQERAIVHFENAFGWNEQRAD
jgi:putative endonuclease